MPGHCPLNNLRPQAGSPPIGREYNRPMCLQPGTGAEQRLSSVEQPSLSLNKIQSDGEEIKTIKYKLQKLLDLLEVQGLILIKLQITRTRRF